MKREFKTPKEVLQYIADVYSECYTFNEITESGLNEFICVSINRLCSFSLKNKTKQYIIDNYELSKVGNELEAETPSFWYIAKARYENREKECIQLKVDFLNKLIEKL
jgi:hypothetical protein